MKEAGVGEWQSPITSELITSSTIRLAAPYISPDGKVFWVEGRPTEGGRQVLVARSVAQECAPHALLAHVPASCCDGLLHTSLIFSNASFQQLSNLAISQPNLQKCHFLHRSILIHKPAFSYCMVICSRIRQLEQDMDAASFSARLPNYVSISVVPWHQPCAAPLANNSFGMDATDIALQISLRWADHRSAYAEQSDGWSLH